MLLITIILLVVLFYWRLFVVNDLNLLTTVFWIVFPDLGSFIPIGLAMREAKEWPRWGPSLYNFFHTFLVWIPVFAVWSILSGGVQWPLLGWAGHITADRPVRYYLRAAFFAVSPCYHLRLPNPLPLEKSQNRCSSRHRSTNLGIPQSAGPGSETKNDYFHCSLGEISRDKTIAALIVFG